MKKVWIKYPTSPEIIIVTDINTTRPEEYSFLINSFDESADYTANYSNGDYSLVEIPGSRDNKAEKLKRDILEEELFAVDKEVETTKDDTFLFNGNNYYADIETIQGIFVSLPYLPQGFTRLWKTADKNPNGVDNIYVLLDKTGLTMLAMTLLQFKSDRWDAGEQKKKDIKEKYKKQ